MDYAILVLKNSFDGQKLAARDCEAIFIVEVRCDDALAMPVSSSMEMKMNPLAVPGRCRAITQPAARTTSPSLQSLSCADVLATQFRPAAIHWVLVGR